MTTITKERLLTIKQWRETYGPGSNVVLPAEEAEELARIALASLEAEPVGAFHIAEQQVDGTSDYIKDGEWPIDNGIIEVYAALPAPVFNGEYGDAYQGAREDLSIWKRRALEAEEHVRRLEQINDHMVKEAQGESRMGEPVIREPAPIAPEAIENAIEFIRSIAFHINEDDYHGKHIAHYMQQALAWLEGHSCSADSQDKSDNSPLPRYQVIELTMLVKQLVSQLKKAKPDCKLPDRAMDYLLRNGLVSVEGVLR